MNPSAELRDLVFRLYESQSSGDVSMFERLISHQDGVLVIGTDPAEWWVGYDTIDRVFKAQLHEMGGNIQIKAGELSAYVEGTAGWAADTAKVRLPNGQEFPIRVTIVFNREGGEWKIVQYHASLGVPNAEAFGKDLTV